MVDTTKLSVEKALEKIRESDQKQSGTSNLDEKAATLNDEINRMRAQRLRLERRDKRT